MTKQGKISAYRKSRNITIRVVISNTAGRNRRGVYSYDGVYTEYVGVDKL